MAFSQEPFYPWEKKPAPQPEKPKVSAKKTARVWDLFDGPPTSRQKNEAPSSQNHDPRELLGQTPYTGKAWGLLDQKAPVHQRPVRTGKAWDLLDPSETSSSLPAPRSRSFKRIFLLYMLPVFLFSFLVLVVGMRLVAVHGDSMTPAIKCGQVMLAWPDHSPSRGDVFVWNHGNVSRIKRVVGLPSETISRRGGNIYINGKMLSNPWAKATQGEDITPTKIGPGKYYLLGDHADMSVDSSRYGPIPQSQLTLHAHGALPFVGIGC